jgi:LemA protein
MSTTTWVVLGVIAVIAIWAIMTYNSLVAMAQRVNQSFADIDVQLKQRSDLIPNLVETVKGYAAARRWRWGDAV